ncbi:MAG: rhombotarget lipoprotein [Woeseiaceae bacterium]
MKYRFLFVVLPLVLAGCTSLWMGPGYEKTREGASSSLVDYLYPNGEIPPGIAEQIPQISLPATVGIAFVPTYGQQDITAKEKQELLEQVAEGFRDRDYVDSIVSIPDHYLRSTRGVTGMQQVAALYGADIMALVSYDQVSFSGERDSAILYWTIVGALVVKGNTNEVQTMIDTAVFDVGTGKLLFRAPGMHRDQINSTLMDNKSDLRKMRSASFVSATDDMVVNLDTELAGFQESVRGGTKAEVQWREGYGGGAVSWPLLALLAGTLLVRNRRRD